jgi:L-threonine kinase
VEGEERLKGKALCPASCGEIVQGMVQNRNFLVTCPISLFTQATVYLCKNHSCKDMADKSNIKAYQAAMKALEYFGVELVPHKIIIRSQIPRGIGLSSSTADITATCLSVASALGKTISPDKIADIALSIEPSDGIMYAGTMIFDHIGGKWRENLGPIPQMDVYIINTGETLDTCQFNRRNDLYYLNLKKASHVEKALNITRHAIKTNNGRLLGRAMRESAVANQCILFKPHLPEIIKIAQCYGAVGVNTAHSGTALGIFFQRDENVPSAFFRDVRNIVQKYEKSCMFIKTKTINHGPKILKN